MSKRFLPGIDPQPASTTNRLKRSTALLAGVLLSIGSARAQTITSYAFSQNIGTYTPIVGGTLLATASASDDLGETVYNNLGAGLPIGFTYRFNSANYTTFSLSSKGFVTFGGTPPSEFDSPISSGGTYSGAVSALGSDIVGNTAAGTGAAGQIRYETIGSAPARTLVVQFSNFQPRGASTSLINFQVRLHEGSNVASLNYGLFQVAASVSTSGEVGLRGSSSAAFNNRTTTTDWTQSTPGASRTATILLTSTVKPPTGLVYSFTPPNSCPSPQQLNVNTITDNSADLTFVAASPAPAGGYTVTTSPASGGRGPSSERFAVYAHRPHGGDHLHRFVGEQLRRSDLRAGYGDVHDGGLPARRPLR